MMRRVRDAMWGSSVRRGLWLGALGAVLAGCTDFQPVHWGGAVPWEQARRAIYEGTAERSRMVPENGRHVVMPGETVSELARLYRVSAGDIIALNDLERPYFIYVGQVLRLPGTNAAPPDGKPDHGAPVYTVARGDTLSAIAVAHQVSLGDLIALNREIDPRRLHVGTRLRLPAGGATMVAGNGGPTARPAAAAESPARSQGKTQAIQTARAEPQPVPAPPAEPVIRAVPLPPPPAAREAVSAVDLAETTDLAGTAPSAAERDAARQRDLAAVEAPPLTGEGFIWPVAAGEVVSAFGAKPDGRRNDGINIKAPEGSLVRAAENGVVVYADQDLAAFGRMLLVRHADGYLSAYAHNEALLVARGDIVARGQPIAKVGRTGEVVEPQLHFEIRRGKGAVDPVSLLGEGEVRLARRD